MSSLEVDHLKTQLSIARKEIQNLRKQMKTLSMVHQKDVQNINRVLRDFRCQNCKLTEQTTRTTDASPAMENGVSVPLKPIGYIRTAFPEKRAVPRQSSIASNFIGSIEISSDVFTNPEHSIDGLQEFSHLWIIYHFHRNHSHAKSKVAPPRLGGERVGVFSTRSPHRPCPIGLSLVEIDRIVDRTIYFCGTDMIDGTPVFDLKPYIPIYDSPTGDLVTTANGNVRSGANAFFASREEPDGEETECFAGATGAGAMPIAGTTLGGSTKFAAPVVKVPNWITSDITLAVVFNERSERQLTELGVDRATISDVLKTDPRSVYLRTKYGSQIFTFQLSEVTVTCKFDDQNCSVTVVQIRKTENLPNGTN